jgi:hypothetical protein
VTLSPLPAPPLMALVAIAAAGQGYYGGSRASLGASWGRGSYCHSLGVGQGDGLAQVPTVVVRTKAAASAGGAEVGA